MPKPRYVSNRKMALTLVLAGLLLATCISVAQTGGDCVGYYDEVGVPYSESIVMSDLLSSAVSTYVTRYSTYGGNTNLVVEPKYVISITKSVDVCQVRVTLQGFYIPTLGIQVGLDQIQRRVFLKYYTSDKQRSIVLDDVYKEVHVKGYDVGARVGLEPGPVAGTYVFINKCSLPNSGMSLHVSVPGSQVTTIGVEFSLVPRPGVYIEHLARCEDIYRCNVDCDYDDGMRTRVGTNRVYWTGVKFTSHTGRYRDPVVYTMPTNNVTKILETYGDGGVCIAYDKVPRCSSCPPTGCTSQTIVQLDKCSLDPGYYLVIPVYYKETQCDITRYRGTSSTLLLESSYVGRDVDKPGEDIVTREENSGGVAGGTCLVLLSVCLLCGLYSIL